MLHIQHTHEMKHMYVWLKTKEPTWMNRPRVDKRYSLGGWEYLIVQEADFKL